MTDVELYNDRALAVADHQTNAVHRLSEWATSAQAASTVAEQLVRTSFVPESFRGKPYEATAAILSGLEMGLSPMASLRSFDVIQGQAAPRAITLRAVALAHGHEVELVESTSTRCVMRGKRAGSSTWQKVSWTIDRAKSMNLTGKSNWKLQPQAMLVARATSEICRLVAADAILGIAYSAEELIDGAGVGAEVVTATTEPPEGAEETPAPAPSGSKRMKRRTTPAADQPPPPPEEDGDIADGEVVDETPTLSDAQMRKIRAQYGDLGVNGAAEQKRVTALILKVDAISSHSDLTVEQASVVIETLSAIEQGFVEFVLDDDANVTGISDAEQAQ